jgi:YD repeat-containing protein
MHPENNNTNMKIIHAIIATVAIFLASCANVDLAGPITAQVIDKQGNTVIYGPNGIEAVVTKDGVKFVYDKEHGLVAELERDGVKFRYDKEGGLVAIVDLREPTVEATK